MALQRFLLARGLQSGETVEVERFEDFVVVTTRTSTSSTEVELYGDARRVFLDGVAAMRAPQHAGCVLICRDGLFAAIRSRKNHGQVEIPGGKLHDGETAAQAAIRETHEETGLECSGLVEIYAGMVNGWVGHVFLADATGELRSSDEGEAFWATAEDILGGTYAAHAATFMPIALRVLRAMGKIQ